MHVITVVKVSREAVIYTSISEFTVMRIRRSLSLTIPTSVINVDKHLTGKQISRTMYLCTQMRDLINVKCVTKLFGENVTCGNMRNYTLVNGGFVQSVINHSCDPMTLLNIRIYI